MLDGQMRLYRLPECAAAADEKGAWSNTFVMQPKTSGQACQLTCLRAAVMTLDMSNQDQSITRLQDGGKKSRVKGDALRLELAKQSNGLPAASVSRGHDMACAAADVAA